MQSVLCVGFGGTCLVCVVLGCSVPSLRQRASDALVGLVVFGFQRLRRLESHESKVSESKRILLLVDLRLGRSGLVHSLASCC